MRTPLAPNGKRQAGLVEPPLARVDDQLQVLLGVGELTFVDDQPGVDRLAFVLAGNHDVQDPIEGHDHLAELHAQAQPQGQIGGREHAGHGDRRLAIGLQRLLRPRHEHGAIAIAHARPAGAQHVAVGQMGIGVQAQGRQFQLAAECPAIERFDIDQFVPEEVRPGVDLAAGQGVEHEGVVGVGAMADTDLQAGIFHG